MRSLSATAAAAAFSASAALSSASALAADKAAPWIITKSEWSEADEKGFSDFVRAIGHSGCTTSAACLKVAANPYRDSDPKILKLVADCADFPYMLRAYYAWKNGLPFAYVNAVAGGGGDLRYDGGNTALSRRELIDEGNGLDALEILKDIRSTVSTATYRTDPSNESGVISDFYAPKLKPGSIRPGTAAYDTHGHVVLVYDIEPDGRLDYMDANPDLSVTRGVYGIQFGDSPAKLGGGLKNFRPLKLVGATRVNGHFVGGHITYKRNDEIADFSLEQYRGNAPGLSGDGKTARFVYNGVPLGRYEYLRVVMSGGSAAYNPIYELRASMRGLCRDLKERAAAVERAIRDGISNKAEPEQRTGDMSALDAKEWETYATLSGDLRIKTGFAALYANMRALIELWRKRDPRIVYDGLDLKADLARAYADESADCSAAYRNSRNEVVTLSFETIENRLSALDFDPYHCAEGGSGAADAEFGSCKEPAINALWYQAEAPLRATAGDGIRGQAGLALMNLETAGTGAAAPPQPSMHLKALIANMGERVPFVGMKPVGR